MKAFLFVLGLFFCILALSFKGAATATRYRYQCSDEEETCSSWAERGDCQTNPRWMFIHCEKSCGRCESCRDYDRDCAGWAERGDCVTYSDWMFRHCKKSCLHC